MKLPKSVKKVMKSLRKQPVLIQVALLVVVLYSIKYLLKQFNIAVLDSHYLEGYSNIKEKTFVFFKMENCGFCKRMAPEWEKFTQTNDTGVAHLVLEASKDKAAMEHYGVTGFPTLMLIDANGVIAKYEEPERTAEKFKEFIKQHA